MGSLFRSKKFIDIAADALLMREELSGTTIIDIFINYRGDAELE